MKAVARVSGATSSRWASGRARRRSPVCLLTWSRGITPHLTSSTSLVLWPGVRRGRTARCRPFTPAARISGGTEVTSVWPRSRSWWWRRWPPPVVSSSPGTERGGEEGEEGEEDEEGEEGEE